MDVDGEAEEEEEEGDEEPPYVHLHPPVAPPLPAEGDRRTPALQRIADIKRKEEELARRLQEQGDAFEDDYILMPRLEVLALDSPLWEDPAAFEQHVRDKEGCTRAGAGLLPRGDGCRRDPAAQRRHGGAPAPALPHQALDVVCGTPTGS